MNATLVVNKVGTMLNNIELVNASNQSIDILSVPSSEPRIALDRSFDQSSLVAREDDADKLD